MLSRVSQLARHVLRPLPNFAHTSAVTSAARKRMSMASSTDKSRGIHTAACLIIGDEVLGGKTVDGKVKLMFKPDKFGIHGEVLLPTGNDIHKSLKKIEVIADNTAEIVEAVRRMSKNYDFVVTSGGIGPTHDDITYQSIASAFSLPLILHEETLAKMKKLSKPHPSQLTFYWDTPSPALTAKLRMATLPIDTSSPLSSQVLFPCEELWVPVCCVNGNVHILPGVPRLFEKLLDGMEALLLPRLSVHGGKGVVRILISTPLAESEIAEYLTGLAVRVEKDGIKVGSYPRWGKSRNTVSLVGRDKQFIESLVEEVEKNVRGNRVAVEGEDDSDIEETKE